MIIVKSLTFTSVGESNDGINKLLSKDHVFYMILISFARITKLLRPRFKKTLVLFNPRFKKYIPMLNIT